jgi:cobalamin biosynthesis protein CobD/CbiB
MPWTTLGTALALALTAFALALLWGLSPIAAIFLPAAIVLIVVALVLAISVAASDIPVKTAHEFCETIKHDVADIVKLFRSWGKGNSN